MEGPTDLVSPKQASRALGVSESSLKRWCDQGLIQSVRTAGGHRKMAIAEVLRFVQAHDHQLVSPELLGLPAASPGARTGLVQGAPRLAEALLAGEETLARQIIYDLYLAKHPFSVIFDEVVAAAFREIGVRWECHTADVYQERRGCEIVLRILWELRRVQPMPKRKWLACGGTIAGDPYAIPSAMAEVVLRGAGFHATVLGTSIPFTSYVHAVEETKPTLFWLSASHIPAEVDFVGQFATLSQACQAQGTALVVGGRALTDGIRQRITYTAYCDTMQHLEMFSKTLIRSPARARAKMSRGSAKPGKLKTGTETHRQEKRRGKN